MPSFSGLPLVSFPPSFVEYGVLIRSSLCSALGGAGVLLAPLCGWLVLLFGLVGEVLGLSGAVCFLGVVALVPAAAALAAAAAALLQCAVYLGAAHFSKFTHVWGQFRSKFTHEKLLAQAFSVSLPLKMRKTTMQQWFSQLGADDTGIITYDMLQEQFGTPAVREYFESLGLDISDAWSFFKLLDMDGGGAVEIEEFLMGCLRLRGNARAMDMAKLMFDQNWLIKSQGQRLGLRPCRNHVPDVCRSRATEIEHAGGNDYAGGLWF
eukprot:s2779_g7.t1